KIPVHRLDVSQPLEKYGVDSILVLQMTNALGEVFDGVSSTLFFEHHTIEALADHFIHTQQARLVALLGLEQRSPDIAPHPVIEPFLEGRALQPETGPYRRPDFHADAVAPRTKVDPARMVWRAGYRPSADTVAEDRSETAGHNEFNKVPAVSPLEAIAIIG